MIRTSLRFLVVSCLLVGSPYPGAAADQFRAAITVESAVDLNSPLLMEVDFRKLVKNAAGSIRRDSIRMLADKIPVPFSVSRDVETSGKATIAWRSVDAKRRDYQLEFGLAPTPGQVRNSGPIGIGDTFHFNHGQPGAANVTPLHSQFIHVDWDGDGLRDLIGWGYRFLEHGQPLEKRLGNAVYFLKNVGTESSPLFAPRRRVLDDAGAYLRTDLQPQNWFVGDLDEDGDPDFFGFGPAFWLTWWENTGKRDTRGLWQLKPGRPLVQLLQESEFRAANPGVLRKRNAWAPRGVRRVDWEGDGDLDLIVAYRKVSRLRVVDTSKGVAPYGTAIMIFDLWENLGTGEDSKVNYARPVSLKDHLGIVVHGRGHANGCLEYADWDGDGDYDLLFHSETDRPLEGGRLMFSENRGTRTEPLFEAPIAIDVRMVDSPFLVDWNNDGRLDLISNGEFYENVNPKSQVTHSLPDPLGLTRNPQAVIPEPIRGRTMPGTRLPKISTYPKFVSRGTARQVEPEIMNYFTVSVDWENDGDLDLIGGYRTGIRLFRNRGTTLKPVFDSPVMLRAGDREISMPNWLDPQSDDPSTYGPQGPTEPMYGWLCPTVGDWDGDGDLDMFATGQRWETRYFENTGTRERPKFARGRTVAANGLTDMLAWRSKISIGDLDADGTMELVIHSDRDNAFRVCAQADQQPDPSRVNFAMGASLKLENGDPIRGWYGGQNNNSDNHTLLIDWDADGDLDLINGTLWAVFYYENTGTKKQAKFKAHGKFQLNGKDLHAFNHAGSFDAADWNEDGRLDLILGTEGPSDQPQGAVLHLFDRDYLEGNLPNVSIGKVAKQ
jgi:hypothetical protein